MAAYTTTDFLTTVRNRGNLPTTTNSNNVASTANLLRVATEELHIRLVPIIMSVREEFYVRNKDFAITADQAAYTIPHRASGMVLRDVQIIYGSEIRSLPYVDPEQISTTASGVPEGYYFEDDSLILYPTPVATSGTLRMRYFLRPSTLVATSACAQITAIDTAINSVTVSSLPSTWAIGDAIDFVKQNSPHKCLEIDQATTNIAGTTVTFASLPDGLAVGDWLALAETTPAPQVPADFRPVLAQMTVVQILEASGDTAGADKASKTADRLVQHALSLMAPRNQGERKVVIQRNWRF